MSDEWKPSKLLHYWERPEYWEESWRLEETCCHSNSNGRPSANVEVKKLIIIMIIIIVNFAVSAEHRGKLKECEKRDKYFDLAKELKKLWNMKELIIAIVIGALGTVTKELVQGREELEKENEWRPSELLHFWGRPEYWERSWRLVVTCCYSDSSEKPSANAGVKKTLKRERIIITIIISVGSMEREIKNSRNMLRKRSINDVEGVQQKT